MGLTKNLGTLAQGVFSDSSLNIGIGGAPSGSFKFEVTGTGKFSGALTATSATFSGTPSLGSTAGDLFWTSLNSSSTQRRGLFMADGATINMQVYTGGNSTLGAFTEGVQTLVIGTGAAGGGGSGEKILFHSTGRGNMFAIDAATQVNTSYFSLNAAAGLTGTSATFSALNDFINNTAASTTTKFIRIGNTGADMAIGVEGSTPSQIVSGSGGIAYSTVLKTVSTTALILGTNSIAALTLNGSTQAATFSSSATATAFIPSSATIPTNGMYLSAANTLAFATNSTNRLLITSGGNVEVRSAGQLIAYRSDNTRSGAFFTDGVAVQITSSNDPIRISSADRTEFYTGGSERMRITSGGNVGIGTTSPQLNTNNGTFLTVQGTNTSGWLELATTSTSDGNGGLISFNNTNIVGSDKRVATIYGLRDGANNSAYLGFATNNAGSNAERMRITSGGNVLIGTTTDNGNRLQVNGNTSIKDARVITNSDAVLNGGTITVNTQGGGFSGFMIVSSSLSVDANFRTQTTYSYFGRGTNLTVTQISTANGPSGSSTFTVQSGGGGIIQVTNTSGQPFTSNIIITLFGSVSP
jgi:hypothetical protein